MPRAAAVLALSLLAFVAQAAAQDVRETSQTPRLKREATVAGELVRIGDLVEHAGRHAETAIFRAPDPGESGVVPVRRVLDAILPHGLTLVDTDGVAEIVVHRASRAVSRREIEERIARALAAQAGLSDPAALTISFDREVRTVHADPAATAAIQVERVHYDPRAARFDVTLDLPGSPRLRNGLLRFTGTAVETVEAAVVTRAVSRGEVIARADIEIARRPKTGLAADVVADLEQAAGMAARRPLRAGDVLRASDLAKPPLVHRNEPVLLVYEAPGIAVTVRGKASESGAEGDVVNVVNIQSKRTVQGLVTGPNRVTVLDRGARHVEGASGARSAMRGGANRRQE